MLQKSTTAVPMLFASVTKYRATVHVNQDILVMDRLVKANMAFSLLLSVNMFPTKFVKVHE